MKTRKLTCIMLIDNNPDDNFYHSRIIKKTDPSIQVLVMASATEALKYLQSAETIQPNLILLDINMPGINGWDFMELYQMQKSLSNASLIIMLTTSENPDDRKRALESGTIADCLTKPLTAEMLKVIKEKFFN